MEKVQSQLNWHEGSVERTKFLSPAQIGRAFSVKDVFDSGWLETFVLRFAQGVKTHKILSLLPARRHEMTAAVEVSAFAVQIPELATGKERVELTEKIPARIFAEILAHARSETNKANFTENLYAVCRNDKSGGYYWREISRSRSFGSTIARDDDPAYQNALLEIHTHPILQFKS